MLRCRCPLSISLRGSCIVVVIVAVVAGQSTTKDDDYIVPDLAPMSTMHDRLYAELADYRRELAKALSRIDNLEAERSARQSDVNNENNGRRQFGASYIRWGRKSCNATAQLIYRGYSAGPHYNVGGGGSNFLCLPEYPQWKTEPNGDHRSGSITGVQYALQNSAIYRSEFSLRNNGGHSIWQHPAPCAACYMRGRSTVLMIPAKTRCPDGWTMEYWGFLVSERATARHRSTYMCLDEAPEVAVGGTSGWQSLVFTVEAECGSLPCSLFSTGRELTCVVCSK